MPADYGRTILGNPTGYAVRVSADAKPNYKIGGISLSSAKLPVNGSGATLALFDQTQVLNGGKYMRYGTILCRITGGAADTATITGAPTGGTFTLSVTAGGTTTTTAGLAFNAAAATVQTALQGLANVGAGNATVTGSAGGPYTITFPGSLGAVTLAASGAGLTGGTTPGVTVGVTYAGGDLGYFAPYDATATDGRQTLTPGDCYVLDETWLDTPTPALPNFGTAHPAVFDGGRVDKAKLMLSTVTAPNGTPTGPTFAAFVAAFPNITYVND